MDHAGAVLGPLVAWWLLAAGRADLRAVIGASIAPGVVVVLLALWAVRDAARPKAEAREEERQGPTLPAAAASVDTPVPVRAVTPLFAIACFYLLRMPDTLIILRSQQLGVPVAVVPLLWAAVHVVRSSSSFLGGAASDRLGPTRTMWAGWLLYAALALAMARAQSAGGAWAVFLGIGLVAGLTESPERALVARLAGARQGSGFGIYHGVTGFAALVGGVALGAAFQAYGARPAFVVSALGGLALVVAWPVVALGDRR
jgi:MFS family permease